MVIIIICNIFSWIMNILFICALFIYFHEEKSNKKK